MSKFEDIAKQASKACIPVWDKTMYNSKPNTNSYDLFGLKIDQQISEEKITAKECLGAYSLMLIAGLTIYYDLGRKQETLSKIEGIEKIITASDFCPEEKDMLQRILKELTCPEKEKPKITLNDIQDFPKEYFKNFCYGYIGYRDNHNQ